MASTSNLPLTGGIPAVLTNAKIYRDGIDLLGVASVELPDFEYLTESLTGLGISGEMDIPVAGQFKALPLKIKWNVPTASATSLLEAVGHYLEARGSIQQLDPGTGTFVQKAFKLVSKAMPKKVGLGKLEPAKKMESESELELYYLKLSHRRHGAGGDRQVRFHLQNQRRRCAGRRPQQSGHVRRLSWPRNAPSPLNWIIPCSSPTGN